jgi:hypothetical protein
MYEITTIVFDSNSPLAALLQTVTSEWQLKRAER